MINSKILFGNIFLILVILFTFYFIRNNIKISKESFESTTPSLIDNCKRIINESEEMDSSNDFDNLDNLDNMNYNNKNINICKYIAYENNSPSYLQKRNMKSYDAYQLCKNDPQCKSFSFNGRGTTGSSDINFYNDNSNITENKLNWSSQNYPNLYIKKRGNCLVEKEVSYISPEITPQYTNTFITNYRDLLNSK